MTADDLLIDALVGSAGYEVLTFSAYFVLPHSLSVTGPFPLFAEEPLWAGWDRPAAERVFGLPLPENIRPLARLRFRPAVGGGGQPAPSADQNFPDIVDRHLSRSALVRRRLQSLASGLRWRRAVTTGAEITLFRQVRDLEGPEATTPALTTEALRLLSLFSVSVGIMSRDGLIGSLAPGDLRTPARFRWQIVSSDGGARTQDDGQIGLHLLEHPGQVADPALSAAAGLFRAGREGDEPAFPISELRLEAQREALRGRRDNAVLLWTSSIEALVDLCLRNTAGPLGRNPANVQLVLEAPILTRLGDLCDVLPWSTNLPLARDKWVADCYELRKAVIHEGEIPRADQIPPAMEATYALTSAVSSALAADPRTRGVAGSLPERPPATG